ncbi:lanthionine synthetase LanC family protein [Protofrankia symbiont of Coriaria ruscifolia]|uniref:lanthionine synthetase LanC family protein n=1 Tax=Protofrankia symbiont of Coriaria ruscifolia TaxID=1306542 RepID=UPI00104123D6
MAAACLHAYLAIDRICAELGQWRCGTPGRRWWPGMVSPSEWKAGAVQQPGPQRPSWCYGTPGLARAQQLAALALGDRRRQHKAESALAGCLVDEKQLAQLGDAGVCHGWAGLVQTTRRAAADAGPDSALAASLPALHTRFEQHLHRVTQATDDTGRPPGSTNRRRAAHPPVGKIKEATTETLSQRQAG